MYLQSTFELTLVLDTEKFSKVLSKVYDKTKFLDKDEYLDNTLASKGITVVYRDSQYKKKVKLIVKPALVLDDDEPGNISKLLHKLEKRVDSYFDSTCQLNNFKLTGMILTADINVGNREKVAAYLKALQKVGKVKGFSPSSDNWLDDDISFCLDGNSNGIEFMTYDLEGLLREQLNSDEHRRKLLKTIIDKSKGLLRAEVRLTKSKAIRDYTDKTVTSKQIDELLGISEKIFLDTFQRIIPFGDFHKKDKAVEIIKREVSDRALRRRMLRLLELVPEKKSLLLAQKALNYRRVDDVMETFAAIDLSPVTLSKRHNVKKLDNLYKYL